MGMRRLLAHYGPDGPSVYEVFADATTLNIVAWALSGVFALGTLIIWFRHWRTLRAAPESERRSYVLGITRLGFIFPVTTFLPLFFVRAHALFGLVRALQEAVSIDQFVRYEIDLLGGIHTAGSTLQAAGPKQILGVPPFCCFCRLCCPLVTPTEKIIRMCRWAATQFVYIVPATAFIGIWIQLETMSEDVTPWVGMMLINDSVKLASSFLALWALMIMHFACKDELAGFRVTRKLVAIKLVVIFGVIQGIIFSITISHSGGNILIRTYDGIAWENFLLALESLPLAWILAWSFPASELEYHPLPTYTDPRLKDSTRAEDAMTLSTV